jgi:predicted acetyltransferase
VTQPEIVHPVDPADYEGWRRALLRGLLANPYERTVEGTEGMRRDTPPGDVWGVRDGDEWVGTMLAEQRHITVPGRGGATIDVTTDALGGVTVAATHRRRGLLTAMISGSMRAAKERGDALAVLIPAEYPIYGRFGYAPATRTVSYRYLPRSRGAAPIAGVPGTVRHVEAADLGDIAARVFAAARRRTPGQLDRRDPYWPRTLGLDGRSIPPGSEKTWAVHQGPDGPDGLLSWRATSGFQLPEPWSGALRVFDLVAATDDAYRDLWSYLAGIDLIGEIELNERPVDEPVRLLLPDARTLRQEAVTDFLWLRLLDVPAALAARGYATDGELVLDVVDDDLGGYGAGRVELVASGDHVTCAATGRAADLRLPQRALASSYLGGHTLRERRIVGDVEELSTGAVERFDAMFRTAVAPWNQTWF